MDALAASMTRSEKHFQKKLKNGKLFYPFFPRHNIKAYPLKKGKENKWSEVIAAGSN
jgi:hypothetical protein